MPGTGTRQRDLSLPSARRQALGKANGQNFAECLSLPRVWHSAKRFLYRVPAFAECRHSAKLSLPSAVALPSATWLALGKESLCRVPVIRHSANILALGEVAFSRSESCSLYNCFTCSTCASVRDAALHASRASCAYAAAPHGETDCFSPLYY